jgi:hypothetical protein
MRGGLSYDESFMLSREDRTIMNGIVKDNIELTKKSKMPLL